MKKFFAVIASVTLLAFAVPAMAQEATLESRLKALEEEFQCSWKFYGQARMMTWYTRDNSHRSVTGASRTDLAQHTLQSNARIGARVNLGDVIGHMEYGHTGRPDNNVGLRQLWGEWNFGPGKLMLGQAETPTSFFTSTQVFNGDQNLLGWGSRYIGRAPMIRLSMDAFQFALVRPMKTNSLITAGDLGTQSITTETRIPQLQASYNYKTGPLNAHLAGAYQTHKAVGYFNEGNPQRGLERKESIDAWMLALGAIYNMGGFALFGDIQYGENLGNLGQSGQTGDFRFAEWDGFSVQDSEALSWLLGARFRANDMVTFEVGYGRVDTEISLNGIKDERDRQSYYINAMITLAKGVFIVPEIGVNDYGETKEGGVTTANHGKTTYWGLKWQINF